MKALGVIKNKNIILDKTPVTKKLTEGAKVEVIILPVEKKAHRVRTFKLGVKKEYTSREKIYAKD